MNLLGSIVFVMAMTAPAVGLPAHNSDPTAQNPTSAAALEREARQIETMLIAPCCWREQVSVHQSEAAEQVKGEIREMLAAGMVRKQVLDAFVARYSVRILAEPPDRGFARLLYHAPWIVGLGSAVGVTLMIVRFTRRRRTRAQPSSDEIDSDLPGPDGTLDEANDRLDEELRNLD